MGDVRIRVDLRELSVFELDGAIDQLGADVKFFLTAWQWAAWNRNGHVQHLSSNALIVVPDFLYYARLASTGQAKEILKLPDSIISVFKAGFIHSINNFKSLPGLATGDFWTAAETLAAYDLGLLGRNFAGEVVLQYNLADFTWLFERQAFLNAYKRLGLNAAGWGICTQQLPMALSACARWNLKPGRFLYTSGVRRKEASLIEVARRDYFTDTALTLDVTQWPHELVCGHDMADLLRPYDEEWLVSFESGVQLVSHGTHVN